MARPPGLSGAAPTHARGPGRRARARRHGVVAPARAKMADGAIISASRTEAGLRVLAVIRDGTL